MWFDCDKMKRVNVQSRTPLEFRYYTILYHQYCVQFHPTCEGMGDNDFDALKALAKYIPPIQDIDTVEHLGDVVTIIGDVFTVKGKASDSFFEDAVVVSEDRVVLGHIVDMFGLVEEDSYYCAVKAVNCPADAWDAISSDCTNKSYPKVYAVDALSTKMNKLDIEAAASEDEESDQSSTASIIDFEGTTLKELKEGIYKPK